MDLDLIDFEALLQPVSQEKPAGEDPRLDTSPYSVYYNLKDIRNSARAAERRALVDNEPLLGSSYMWKEILEQVPNLLAAKYKDLEFTAWFIEALIRNYGFKGLAAGFKTATILINNFWPYIYLCPMKMGMKQESHQLLA